MNETVYGKPLKMFDVTMSARKKVSETTSNLRVAVRVRPINATERGEKCTNIVKVEREKMAISLNKKSFGPFYRVYDSHTTQTEIYDDLVSSQIKKVIAGFNCTVFAYGQTGTGKTFTMEGGRNDVKSSHDDPTTGIIPRAVEDIFEQLEASGCEEFSLRVSYVELYNEELLDLLASSESDDRERLRIFDDPNKKGVIVQGVEEIPVRCRADVFKLLAIGAERRKTAATLMNMHSSRSHSLFMVNVVVRENTNSGEELVKQGKLNLVDLAGSENIGRSGALGNRAKEAGSINQSLLTLGRVIRSLTTNAQHIPYRESKLTRLLQDSLGGSTITSLIATMSPASSNFEESQSTLEYAMRAANIKNKPVCNTKVSKKTILKEYSDEIEKLRRDLRAAREKNGVIISEESHEEFQKNTEKVHELEQLLDNAVDRLKRFTEDLMHMDEQYKQIYHRKEELEDRLRDRLREMAEMEKDLADTKDELCAHVQALGVMHTAALKSFDQLVESREAAQDLQTDLFSFWRKVDEMKKADDVNKDSVERFVKSVESFIAKMTENTNTMKSNSSAIANDIVEIANPHCKSIDSVANDITSNKEALSATTASLFREAADIEKNAATKITNLSEEIRKQCEDSLRKCEEFYSLHANKTGELSLMMQDRMDQIKEQVTSFSDDIRPLLAEIRGTVCDSVTARREKSASMVDDVKATCATMTREYKEMMSRMEHQMNQLTSRIEEQHKEQVIADQAVQESVLDTINTIENTTTSLEDQVDETCDVEEDLNKIKEAVLSYDTGLKETMADRREGAASDDETLKKLISTLVEDGEAVRSNANDAILSQLDNLSVDSERCKETSGQISVSANETSERIKTVLNTFESTSAKAIQEANYSVTNLHLQHVDPNDNVPERTTPQFPDEHELVTPPAPETLLSNAVNSEEDGDVSPDVLAKKKRRVTSFVRRDSLLDTTNVFMSPTSILKRREQTIDEEEDVEN